MSKPDFVPNDALFYATTGLNTLHAVPDEDSLDVWIEDGERFLCVELTRERVRRVAQALLQWADDETGPKEI